VREVFNRQEAAEYLGVSKETVTAWCKKGALRHVKFGRSLRIRKEWCIEFLEERAAGGSHTPVADAMFAGRG
jgi:excisionase family DNA binding protein